MSLYLSLGDQRAELSAADHFLNHLSIVYVLTVIGKNDAGDLVTRGLFS